LADFWRMVWEQNSKIIVMLTKLFESGKTKAHIYWPHERSEPVTHGEISVTLLDEYDENDSFTLRQFALSWNEEVREVYQLHYTEWPDFGIPDSTKGIRELCAQVEALNINHNKPHLNQNLKPGPIVVHCSAGIGRSGSFIAVHHCLTLEGQQEVKISEITKQMRCDRIGMVQTEKQYEFIYRALKEHREETHYLYFQNSRSIPSPPGTLVPSSVVPTALNWRHRSSDGTSTISQAVHTAMMSMA